MNQGKPCVISFKHPKLAEEYTFVFMSHLEAFDTADKWRAAGWKWTLTAINELVELGGSSPQPPNPYQVKLF